MAETDHPNVEAIRAGFDALAQGDFDTALHQLAPDLEHYGAGVDGTHRLVDRDGMLQILLEASTLNAEYTNDVVDLFAVGDSIVMGHLRGRRRSAATGEALDFDYMMAWRFRGGVIVQSVDLVDTDALPFFARLAAEEGET